MNAQGASSTERNLLIYLEVFIFFFYFLILSILNKAYAIDCKACAYQCGKNLSCLAKKGACKDAARIFSEYDYLVIGGCANLAGRMDEREKIERAKNLLINFNFFTPDDLINVEINWCNLNNYRLGGHQIDSSGIVPKINQIYLNETEKNSTDRELAILIAHEMVHVQQYRNWDTEGFRCRYMVDLA